MLPVLIAIPCEESNSLIYKMSRSTLHVKESQVRVQKRTKRAEEGNKVFAKILSFPSGKCT